MLRSRVIEGVRTMARPGFPRTLAEFQSRFVTEDDCRRYLVECRWPGGYQCPYVRPDLQYVIKPNGFSDIDDALVIGFEAGITF